MKNSWMDKFEAVTTEALLYVVAISALLIVAEIPVSASESWSGWYGEPAGSNAQRAAAAVLQKLPAEQEASYRHAILPGSPDILHLFWIDASGTIQTRRQVSETGVWLGPSEQVPGNAKTSGRITVTGGGRGNIFLFITGSDESVYLNERTYQGSWSGWQGDVLANLKASSISATNYKDTIFLFASSGSKGQAWAMVNTASGRDNRTWTGWTEVPRSAMEGGQAPSNIEEITAVGTRYGHLILFAKASDGTLYLNKFVEAGPMVVGKPVTGNWSGWTRVPGDLKAYEAPSASEFVATIYLFAIREEDGRHNIYINTASARTVTDWSGWNLLGKDWVDTYQLVSAASRRAIGDSKVHPRFMYLIKIEGVQGRIVYVNRFGDPEAVPPLQPQRAEITSAETAHGQSGYAHVFKFSWYQPSSVVRNFYLRLRKPYPEPVYLTQYLVNEPLGHVEYTLVVPAVAGRFCFDVIASNGWDNSPPADAGCKEMSAPPEPSKVENIVLRREQVWSGAIAYVWEAISYFKLVGIEFPMEGNPGILAITFPKKGYTTSNCNDPKAVVQLTRDQKATPSQLEELYGSITPEFGPGGTIVACVSAASWLQTVPDSVFVLITAE